jgi:hypothetical protein
MKTISITLALLLVAAVASAFGYEWRYSADMQEHIRSVNRNLQTARLQATYATGLIGSIQAMTAGPDVGGEIMSTHDHVHTLKDQVLAWRIKKAIEQSVTVGDAIQNAIAKWPESISDSAVVTSPSTAPTVEAVKKVSPTVEPTKEGYWQLDHDTNPVTGVVKTTAYLKYQGDRNIYVRRNGKTLQCYITTGEFMETASNLDSRVSTVQYRFDGGHVVRQGWWVGDDNETLFYPGNCAPFLKQLGQAKSMAFEYHPAGKIESTVTFDVTGFPNVFNVSAPLVATAKHHAVEKPCVLWELATPACHEKN